MPSSLGITRYESCELWVKTHAHLAVGNLIYHGTDKVASVVAFVDRVSGTVDRMVEDRADARAEKAARALYQPAYPYTQRPALVWVGGWCRGEDEDLVMLEGGVYVEEAGEAQDSDGSETIQAHEDFPGLPPTIKLTPPTPMKAAQDAVPRQDTEKQENFGLSEGTPHVMPTTALWDPGFLLTRSGELPTDAPVEMHRHLTLLKLEGHVENGRSVGDYTAALTSTTTSTSGPDSTVEDIDSETLAARALPTQIWNQINNELGRSTSPSSTPVDNNPLTIPTDQNPPQHISGGKRYGKIFPHGWKMGDPSP